MARELKKGLPFAAGNHAIKGSAPRQEKTLKRGMLLRLAAEVFPEDAAIAAGRKAELLVGQYIAALLRRRRVQTGVWHDIRVPRSDGQGKYEIDYLIATPYGALVIEVKNFAGRLERDPANGRWIQTSQSMQRRSHECPLTLTAQKIAALAAFLERNGIACPPDRIHLRVVMAHPLLRLTRQLAQDPRICSPSQLDSTWDLLRPRRKGLFSWNRPVFPHFKRLLRHLNRLPTWDEIELHGGKVLRGDIQRDFRNDLPPRLSCEQIDFAMPRHRIWGWVQPCYFRARIRTSSIFPWRWGRVLRPESVVKIQLAGAREITEVKLYQIQRLRYGWADESYYHRKS